MTSGTGEDDADYRKGQVSNEARDPFVISTCYEDGFLMRRSHATGAQD